MILVPALLMLNRHYRFRTVTPDQYDNELRAKTISDLRCYMQATTVKNPLVMIDEFEAGYPAFLAHERQELAAHREEVQS